MTLKIASGGLFFFEQPLREKLEGIKMTWSREQLVKINLQTSNSLPHSFPCKLNYKKMLQTDRQTDSFLHPRFPYKHPKQTDR
jgi:hypothetical protein